MRILAALALLIGVAAIGCEPEWKNGTFDKGWSTYAIGLCEGEDEGRTEPGLSCVEAAKCQSFCCQCENGTKYTVAACSSETGCLDFGAACDVVKADACK
ncbi:MAG: hypothetical protein JXR83_22840 [Deltaproteobacteria bacterium]|nr:hypothetical protein [Deltaproteobacteria bacterium]